MRLLLLIVVLLAGCAGLTGPRSDFTIYALNPPLSHSEATALDWQLVIETPQASDLLDSLRIVVAPDGNERQVYRGARWVERAPELLQSNWLRALEADGRLPGVARAGSGVRADLFLASDLIAFQASDTVHSPRVEIEVNLRLIDPRTRRILARTRLRAQEPAESAEVGAAVRAFDVAIGRLNTELIDWVLTQGEQAMQSRRDDRDRRNGS